jgi:hypothetical protein
MSDKSASYLFPLTLWSDFSSINNVAARPQITFATPHTGIRVRTIGRIINVSDELTEDTYNDRTRRLIGSTNRRLMTKYFVVLTLLSMATKKNRCFRISWTISINLCQKMNLSCKSYRFESATSCSNQPHPVRTGHILFESATSCSN